MNGCMDAHIVEPTDSIRPDVVRWRRRQGLALIHRSDRWGLKGSASGPSRMVVTTPTMLPSRRHPQDASIFAHARPHRCDRSTTTTRSPTRAWSLTATLAGRLGLETVDRRHGHVSGFGRAASCRRWCTRWSRGATASMTSTLLRAGATARVLGHDVVAPSTIGTWLRELHVWACPPARPRHRGVLHSGLGGGRPEPVDGDDLLTIDIDSTICRGARLRTSRARRTATPGPVGYTRWWPPAPTPARSCTYARARARPNTGRGAQRFVREDGRAGPPRRRDRSDHRCAPTAGFWSRKVIAACVDHGVAFSITVPRQKVITDAIEQIDEAAWVDIDYTDAGTRPGRRNRLGPGIA